MDLQGPEIRSSFLINKVTGERVAKLEVKAGDKFQLYGTDNLAEVRGGLIQG